MRSSEPEYVRATSLAQASEALRAHGGGALVVAGGTVITSLINQHLVDPSAIVDLSGITDLTKIQECADNTIEIGAMATHDDIHRSALVRAKAPLLARIAEDISSIRLRTRGTIGGSICTVGGQGDPATGLIALGAKLALYRGGTRRLVAVEEFYQDGFTVDISDDELLEKVVVPSGARGLHTAFTKEGPRHAMDWTQLTVAVAYTFSGNKIGNIRVGVNGASPTPVRAIGAEGSIGGRELQEIDWGEVRVALDNDISPESDLVYTENFKRHLTHVLLKRSVLNAAARN